MCGSRVMEVVLYVLLPMKNMKTNSGRVTMVSTRPRKGVESSERMLGHARAKMRPWQIQDLSLKLELRHGSPTFP